MKRQTTRKVIIWMKVGEREKDEDVGIDKRTEKKEHKIVMVRIIMVKKTVMKTSTMINARGRETAKREEAIVKERRKA